MSADNWTVCPKCVKRRDNAIAKAEESYGKVTAAQYRRLLRVATDIDVDETFREDYEIGIADGKFEVGYSGGCSACGYKFNFKESRNL